MKKIKTIFNNLLRLTTGYQIESRRARRLVFIRKHAHFFAYLAELRKLVSADGAVVECGVWQGRSLAMLSILYPEKIVYGFDSFNGFPEGTLDETGMSKTLSKKFSKTSPETVRKKLKECHCPSNTSLIEGPFEKTLPSFKEKISFLHIDCDTYNSVSIVLKYLYPLVQKGGLIAFDEYKDEADIKNWPGAAKAIDEYFGDRVRDIERDQRTGKYFMKI